MVEYKPQSYKEMPIWILDCKEQVLLIKKIPIVKVLWPNHGVEEASLEVEQDIKTRYPHSFKEVDITHDYEQ
jgi:hypothetical protein